MHKNSLVSTRRGFLKGLLSLGITPLISTIPFIDEINPNPFSKLESTLGWSYSGDATEANAFSVSGGKLYQIKNGFTTTDSGYYSKAYSGINRKGWSVIKKKRNA